MCVPSTPSVSEVLVLLKIRQHQAAAREALRAGDRAAARAECDRVARLFRGLERAAITRR